MSADYDNEKKTVESLILTFKNWVKIRDLQRSYEQSFGKKIPYLELGFSSVESFILSMQDSVIARYGYDGSLILKAIGNNDANKHIRNLIEHQNTARKKQPRYRNNTYKSYRPLPYRQNGNSNFWSNKKFGKEISFKAQQRIKALLNIYPDGLNAKDLHFYYCKEYPYDKEDLNHQTLGHNSLDDLLATCDHDMLSKRGSIWDRMYYPVFPVYSNQNNKKSSNQEGHEQTAIESKVDVKPKENIDELRVQDDEIYLTFELEFFKDIITIPVEVGEVYSPDNFYILIKEKSYSEELDQLSSKMENFYRKEENMDVWKIHPMVVMYEQPVVVIHQADESLYRGVVTSFKGMDLVEVFLVDFGTICTVAKENLLYLHKMFFDFPAQAINAKLYNIHMKSSSECEVQRASERMLDLVSGKGSLHANIHFVDVENYSLSLEIIEKDIESLSINETLVQEGYCVYKDEPQEVNDVSKENLTSIFINKEKKRCVSSPINLQAQNGNLSDVIDGINKDITSPVINNGDAISPIDFLSRNENVASVNDGVYQVNKDIESPEFEFKAVNGNVDVMTPIDFVSRNENDASINNKVNSPNLKMYDSFEAFNENSLAGEANLTISSSESCFNSEAINIQTSSEDKIVDAVRSLRIANHCIRVERKKVLERLPGNSSLKETFVRLSTVKANIIALEAELVGIFMLRKGNNN